MPTEETDAPPAEDHPPKLERHEVEELLREQIREGARDARLRQLLKKQGCEGEEAQELVAAAHRQVEEEIAAGTAGMGVLAPAMLGGLVGAVLGGIAWGLLARATGLEIGYVAWGVGLLAGLGARLLAGGRHGLPLQVAAAAASLLGIVVGKYMIFQQAVAEMANAASTGDITIQVPFFSSEMFRLFTENLGNLFGGMDILFVGLALVTAWKIPAVPQRMGSRR